MTISTLSRETIFAIFRPIFLRTRVPPCVFSKNCQKSSKIAILNPGANPQESTNPKNSRGSVDFDRKRTIWRGANPRFFGSFKKCLHCLPPLYNQSFHLLFYCLCTVFVMSSVKEGVCFVVYVLVRNYRVFCI